MIINEGLSKKILYHLVQYSKAMLVKPESLTVTPYGVLLRSAYTQFLFLRCHKPC